MKVPEGFVVGGRYESAGLIQMINATEARFGTFFGDGKYGSGRDERYCSAESRASA
jgi:hypothetical protein